MKITNIILKRFLYLSLLIIIVYILKPNLLYKSDGKIREYGIGNKKTVLTLTSVIMLFAVFISNIIN